MRVTFDRYRRLNVTRVEFRCRFWAPEALTNP